MNQTYIIHPQHYSNLKFRQKFKWPPENGGRLHIARRALDKAHVSLWLKPENTARQSQSSPLCSCLGMDNAKKSHHQPHQIPLHNPEKLRKHPTKKPPTTHTKSIEKCNKGQKTIQKWNNKNKSNANSKKNIWKAITKKHQVQCQIHRKILEKTLQKSFHHTTRTPMQNPRE